MFANDALKAPWIVTCCVAIVTIPTNVFLCLRFWKLRNHFVISQRFYKFSIFIVIFSGIGYIWGFLAFSLLCFGILKNLTQFDRFVSFSIVGAYLATCTVFYRMLLVYLRGKVCVRVLLQ